MCVGAMRSVGLCLTRNEEGLCLPLARLPCALSCVRGAWRWGGMRACVPRCVRAAFNEAAKHALRYLPSHPSLQAMAQFRLQQH